MVVVAIGISPWIRNYFRIAITVNCLFVPLLVATINPDPMMPQDSGKIEIGLGCPDRTQVITSERAVGESEFKILAQR